MNSAAIVARPACPLDGPSARLAAAASLRAAGFTPAFDGPHGAPGVYVWRLASGRVAKRLRLSADGGVRTAL